MVLLENLQLLKILSENYVEPTILVGQLRF